VGPGSCFGAHALAADDDTDWRYVNIRRLALSSRTASSMASRVVFEPNGEVPGRRFASKFPPFSAAWRPALSKVRVRKKPISCDAMPRR
jgi:hypothetical protein